VVAAVVLILGLALLFLAGLKTVPAAVLLAARFTASLVGSLVDGSILALPLSGAVLKEGANRLTAGPDLAGAHLRLAGKE